METIRVGRPARTGSNHRWRFVEYVGNGDRLQVVGPCRSDGGHDDERGARQCYQQWRVQNLIQLVPEDTSMSLRHPLQNCDYPTCKRRTNGYVSERGYHLLDLCADHLNVEAILRVLGNEAADYQYLEWSHGLRFREPDPPGVRRASA